MPDPYRLTIRLTISRDGADIWAGSASTAGLHRKFGELTEFLYRADVFPDGVVLATGTSLVPELPFTLAGGDVVAIAIDGIGALVNAQLRSSLTGRLKHLGIPANFQSIVIHAVETGGVPSNGNTSGAGGAAGAGQGALVQEVIHAAYSAFYAGLHAALLLSAFLVLSAGLFTFVLLGRAAGSDQP